MSSVLCAHTLGPCNTTRDIRCPPTWQGWLTKASPTWGSHLYNSKMSARAVRVLQSTRVVLVLLRAIQAMLCSDSLWAHRKTPARRFCQVSGWSEQAEKAHCHWNRGMRQRRGWSACFAASLVWWSVTLLRWTPGSKSSLCGYLCMLLCLRCINGFARDIKETWILLLMSWTVTLELQRHVTVGRSHDQTGSDLSHDPPHDQSYDQVPKPASNQSCDKEWEHDLMHTYFCRHNLCYVHDRY